MQNRQLSMAVELHQKGDLDKALAIYIEMLDSHNPPLNAFLNASSILRNKEKLPQAVKCLKRGINLYATEPGLYNNLGNCYLDAGRLNLAVSCYRKALGNDAGFVDARISLASVLRDLGHNNLAYAILKNRFEQVQNKKEQEKLLIPLVESILSLKNNAKDQAANDNFEKFVTQVDSELRRQLSDTDPPKAGLVMTQLWIELGQLDRALESRRELRKATHTLLKSKPKIRLKQKFKSQWHNLSWHLAIKLLKDGRFSEGWELYEHGLQVKAEGPQRWQRALKKPFTPEEIPFWKGEDLNKRRILLLAEQGIGDAMMFATLIPSLIREGAKVFFLPGERLTAIYTRSMPDVKILSKDDLKHGRYSFKDFDYQTPIGSICQYRFPKLEDYGPQRKLLKAEKSISKKIKEKYSDGRPIIGISWQGGGKANRIPLKSITLKEMTPLLSQKEFKFVSLQYGDDAPHIEKYKQISGIEILHDDDIDPLNDMEGWLNQVSACDAVISIANTTIHGAGGLGIPTLCLVSRKSDWRWIEPSIYKGCYWYPSVEAVYQSTNGDWKEALLKAQMWLKEKFKPMEV